MNDRYTVERIMEIIAYVIGARAEGTPLAKIDVNELARLGYTDGEISAALNWILERADVMEAEHETDADDSDRLSFRILHGLESETITPEAWGLLLSYRNLGFLSNEDLEQIIERAMMLHGEMEVDLEEIRAIVAVYVSNQAERAGANRHLLSGTESVN